MKKTIILGEYVSKNSITGTQALGDVVVEISDIAVDDWKNQKHKLTGEPLAFPKTINQWKASHGGSSHITFIHPINQQRFIIDLSEWDHIDSDRYPRIDMGWVRKREV